MIDSLLPIMGTRVLIRKLDNEDLNQLYELESDQHVKHYGGGPVTRSRQEWIEGMAGLCSSPYAALPLVITCKATGNFAGRASLSLLDKRCWEIQVLVAKKYWGQRLGLEVTELLMGAAFDTLEASSVIAIVHPQNKASLALVEKLGFTSFGTKQSHGWDNGHCVFVRKFGMP
jgi:[ribosomal protein S5]-alanine N-acetyltransferase